MLSNYRAIFLRNIILFNCQRNINFTNENIMGAILRANLVAWLYLAQAIFSTRAK